MRSISNSFLRRLSDARVMKSINYFGAMVPWCTPHCSYNVVNATEHRAQHNGLNTENRSSTITSAKPGWPLPRSSPCIMINIVRSSISVDLLLPSRWQHIPTISAHVHKLQNNIYNPPTELQLKHCAETQTTGHNSSKQLQKLHKTA